MRRIFFGEGVLLAISLILSVFYIVFSPADHSLFELLFLSGLYLWAKIALVFQMSSGAIWAKFKRLLILVLICIWIILLFVNRYNPSSIVPWKQAVNLLDKALILDADQETVLEFSLNDARAVGSNVGILSHWITKEPFLSNQSIGQVDVYYYDGKSDSLIILPKDVQNQKITRGISLAQPPDISVKPPYFELDYHYWCWSEKQYEGRHVSKIRIKNLPASKSRVWIEGVYLKDV